MAGRDVPGPGAPDEPESDEPESDGPESGEPESGVPAPVGQPDPAVSDRPWWAATAPNPLPAAEPPPLLAPTDAASDVSGESGAQPASAATGATAANAEGAPAKVQPDSVMDQPDRDRTPLRLVWAAGILLAVVILFSLFFLGQRIGSSPAARATPSPTPTPAPTAPQQPGVHVWNTLFGGECLQPYNSPWDHDFTVVDCATPHGGQLVYRGAFDPKSAFPGEAALAGRINDLCTAPGIIDLTAARDYRNLVVQGSYPITQKQWEENPYYYCFVSSESGQPLTADIAGPGPSPKPARAPTPAATG